MMKLEIVNPSKKENQVFFEDLPIGEAFVYQSDYPDPDGIYIKTGEESAIFTIVNGGWIEAGYVSTKEPVVIVESKLIVEF